MDNVLNALEEFDAQRKIQFPYLLHKATDLNAKKKMAYVILAKKEAEMLLISPAGFGEDSVIAGMTEKNMEFFAKFAPKEYKKIFLGIIANNYLVNDILEIAKAMDEDFGKGSVVNQTRVRNVLQYAYDNQIVFHF